MKEEKERSVLREVISTAIYILVIFLLTQLFITYIAQRTDVSGHSMENTLQNNDFLLVDKISYRFKDPERFDIVVFPFEYEEDTYFIKRIIGLPGETVQIDYDGVIYIDGEPLDSDIYGKEVIQNPGRAITPITLGEDEYFVMGDNRNNSMDSRDPAVGNIHRDNLIGRAFIRIYPFSTFGLLH